MKWPRISDIIIFRPTAEEVVRSDTAVDELAGDQRRSSRIGPSSPALEARHERWRRIRFDNAIRLWVAVPTYLTCFALWAGGAIDSIVPMTAVILGYAVVLVAAFTAFFNLGFSRMADYVLGGIDLISMSCAVYLTGATASPLYFIYFVPVVIHAFHRDWDLILFSGFGGVVLYGIAVLVSLNNLSSASVADLCARLVFMLLTVAIACLGLSVLRKEEGLARRRLARLRAASDLNHRLIAACSMAEIRSSCDAVSPMIASALSATDATVAFMFRDDDQVVAHVGAETAISIATDGDASFGQLRVSVPGRTALDEADLSYLRTLARSIALCVRRQKGIEELGRAVELGTATAAIQLAAERSDRAAQTALLEGAMSLLTSAQATLFLWNAGRRRLEATAWMGSQPGMESGKTFLPDQGVIGEAFHRKEARRGCGLEGDALHRDRDKDMDPFLAVPLQTLEGNVLGVLSVSRLKKESAYSQEDALIASALACRAAHILRAALQRQPDAPSVTPRLAA